MKGKTMNIFTGWIMPTILTGVCGVIVYGALTGRQLPLVADSRAALVALLIVGMAACAGGIGQVGASGRWLGPLAIVGYLLGGLILLIIAAGLAGWKLPLVEGELQAVVAVAVLMGIKYVLGTAGFFFHLL